MYCRVCLLTWGQRSYALPTKKELNMSAKIGTNKVSMMKTDDLLAAAKSGNPKTRVKISVELRKRGKADLLQETPKPAAE